jgi:hypothetical protein
LKPFNQLNLSNHENADEHRSTQINTDGPKTATPPGRWHRRTTSHQR